MSASASKATPLASLGLSLRTTGTLARAGISTLEELHRIPRYDDARGPANAWDSHLRMAPGLGRRIEAEILAALGARGLDLAPAVPIAWGPEDRPDFRACAAQRYGVVVPFRPRGARTP